MLKNLAWLGGLVILPLAVFALLTTLPLPAQAQEDPPHIFIGTAKTNGSPVLAGGTVTAWDGDKQIGSATTTDGGNFLIQVNRAPGVIHFKVNGTYAAETHSMWGAGDRTVQFTLTTGVPVFHATTDEPGEGAKYTITFTATADYDPGSDNLVIEMEDFGFPSSVSPSSISIKPKGSNAASPQGVTVDLEKLNITLPDFDPSTSATDTDADKINSGEMVTLTIQHSAGISTPTEGGSYSAVISGPGPDVISPALTIRRLVEISVHEGRRGTQVTATGKGFKDGTSLWFFLDSNGDGERDAEGNLCEVATIGGDDTGSCNFTVNNPPFKPKHNWVKAVDGRGQYVSKVNREQLFFLQPDLQVADSAVAGDTVTVHLLDFVSAQIREVTLAGHSVELIGDYSFGFIGGYQIFDISKDKRFSITIPSEVSGLAELRVTSLGESVSYQVTITDPAAAPAPPPDDPARLFAALPDLVRAFGFDNATKRWDFFDPAAADVSTLTRFMPQHSYWLLVSHTTRLLLNGMERDLYCVEDNCWNLIVW